MSEEIVNKGTTFKAVTLRGDERCTDCRLYLPPRTRAWRPKDSKGSWKRDTILCDDCIRGVRKPVFTCPSCRWNDTRPCPEHGLPGVRRLGGERRVRHDPMACAKSPAESETIRSVIEDEDILRTARVLVRLVRTFGKDLDEEAISSIAHALVRTALERQTKP